MHLLLNPQLVYEATVDATVILEARQKRWAYNPLGLVHVHALKVFTYKALREMFCLISKSSVEHVPRALYAYMLSL